MINVGTQVDAGQSPTRERHQQVQVVVPLDAAQHHRLDRITELERHLVGVDGVDTGHQVVGVEPDEHLGALVLHVDFLDDRPVVLIANRHRQRVAAELEAHRRRRCRAGP